MQVFKFIEEKPRIILMVNDIVGLEITRFLVERKENIVAVFLHEAPNQKLTSEILTLVDWVISSDNIYTADTLLNGNGAKIISTYEPDLIITCYWAHLLKPDIIEIPKYGCLNFHPALLPKNRGWYPSVWPFIDNTPSGVTLHLVDEGADTGPIIAQTSIPVEELDNAGTIYEKCKLAMISLFKETWVKLFEGLPLYPQNDESATYHSKKEGNALNEIDPEKEYKVKDLFSLLKARTFGDKSFAYYKKDNETYRIKLTITKD